MKNLRFLFVDFLASVLGYIKESACGLYTGIACILVLFKFNPTLGKPCE